MKNISSNFLLEGSARGGFTLIELIIVMGIIMIMAVVTLGSLTRSQDQQIFNNSFEKLFSLINTARSLSISGKGQLDYTDFDNDGCTDYTCTVPDYVTPANYGVNFNSSTAPNVILFADMNPPTSETIDGQKGVYNSGTSYATGQDLELDNLTLPAGVSLEIVDANVAPPNTGTIFFSPNYADITFNEEMKANPYLLLRLRQGANVCKQIRIHRLAGIPEVESCIVTY